MKTEATNGLDFVFYPRSIAVVGASPTEFYTIALMMGKLRDHLYLVNPNYEEIHGRKSYASILDIDGPVDYVILALPAKFVLETVRDCVKKNVKVVHSFTSGFSETGLREGIEMERELLSIVKGNLRLLGPNCMGIYCPKSGLSFNPLSTLEEGHIGLISQSGSFAHFFIHGERSRNVKISKMVSYGNAVDLDCPEFLRYMADDPDTNVIALYVEGVKDGRPLRSALEYASSKKPVIALKGGMSRQGGKVASSHTGALAGSGQTWATLFRQTKVVQVDDVDELMNAAIAMGDLKPPLGKGVSIITYSGGFSVVQSDMCAKEGLDVPAFSKAAVEKLRKFVPSSGTMVGNPLDAWPLFYRFEGSEGTMADALRIISGETNIHSIIVQYDVLKYMVARWGKEFLERFDKVASRLFDGLRYARDDAGKLVLVSLTSDPYSDNEIERKYMLAFKKRCESEGFPVYPSLKDAVKTVANMYRYAELKKE
jgi:acyl-CoA synthetase (NDP forming)